MYNSALIRIRSGDGQLHIVTRSLLDKSHYFQAILSQRWATQNEEIEVCCASESFTNLLNILRYGSDASRDLSFSAKYMLLADAEYFGFPDSLFENIRMDFHIDMLNTYEYDKPKFKSFMKTVNSGKAPKVHIFVYETTDII